MTRVDIEAAMAAGLSLVIPLYFLMKWETIQYGTGPFPAPMDIINLSLIIVSYLAISILLQLFKKNALVSETPHWVLISVLGSLLFVIIYTASLLIFTKFKFTTLVSGKWKVFLIIFLVFSFYTLPFTAFVYHGGRIVQSIKRWHSGSDFNPKILRK